MTLCRSPPLTARVNSVKTRVIQLKQRPRGVPSVSDFDLVETRLPPLQEDQVLVRNLWMSVDPYMRGRMEGRKSYIEPFQIDEPLSGGAIGQVMESRHANFPEGVYVSHQGGWREAYIAPGEAFQLVDPSVAPLPAFLGVLGMPGLTAYVGLSLAAPQQGETLFVSAGGGAVGSLVCQLARRRGLRVVASAGSALKLDWLENTAGAASALNYKARDFTSRLAHAAPNGLDIYFDNVGGAQLEAAISHMNNFGRILVCGMISFYNDSKKPTGPRNFIEIISKRLTMRGFIVTDHTDQYPAFIEEVGGLIRSGDISWEETVLEGLERAPEALIGLFEGGNTGKMLVKLSND